ncbi:MAG: ParB/RepB/Spo0J family partition protein [Candidatus Thermoplasmatota archaeon]|nr:ParB/RepB/Spo0J family partition protein [Candidatus Thermoplasmatota archaeon]
MLLDINKIDLNNKNPRSNISDIELDNLADSIRQQGIIEPIVVRPNGARYEIVVGERRYNAAKKAGLDKIPVIIKELNNTQVIEWNLVENIQREDLTDVDKGKTILNMMEEYPEKYPNITAVSKSLSIYPGRISQWVATAKNLTPEVQRMVVPPTATGHGKRSAGKISGYTARVIATKIKDPDRQIKVAKQLSEGKFTHREEQKILFSVAKEQEKSVDEIFKEFEQEPAEIPFRLSHMQPILDGIKTQTSRKSIDPKIREGTIIRANLWQPAFADLIVKKIEKKKLGDFTEKDAKREGGYTLEEFKEVWKNLHGKWDPDEVVNVIIFDKIKR